MNFLTRKDKVNKMMRFPERRVECDTDTQYKVMLSGYQWCAEQIKEINGRTILDAACGAGYGSYYLSTKAKEVTGIDIYPEAIIYCKKRYRRENLTFLEMDCTDLKFSDSSFDIVISQDTIEHIQDDRKFLSEVKRVLKPNGACIIFTPHSLKHTEKPLTQDHRREYSKDTFAQLLKDYFSNIKFYGRRISGELAGLENNLNSIRRYDKFGLKMLIPRKARHLIANLILRLRGNKRLEDVSSEDIEYFEGVEGTPTLIAIGKNG